MVARELCDVARANAIRPAVADMCDVDLVVLSRVQRADDRSAHALDRTVANRCLEDALIRELHRGHQAALLGCQSRVFLRRPIDTFTINAGRIEERGHLRRGHVAGNITGAVAAHAIGDDEQTVLGQDAVAIFVVLSLKSDVGEPCRSEVHSLSHASRSDRGRSEHLLAFDRIASNPNRRE